LPLPYACAGDATTYTTDIRPHRSISIPFLSLLFKGNSLIARGDESVSESDFRHRVGHKPARCFLFSILRKQEEIEMTEKAFLTIRDVQNYLNISQSAAYELAHRKDFPCCRIGGTIRVPRDAFFAWVEMKTSIAPQLRSFMAADIAS